MSQSCHTLEATIADLKLRPRTWLVTGVAGFIGSNLLEHLLKLDQRVVGIDNFATGFEHNLWDVQRAVSGEQWSRFRFIQADICNPEVCMSAAIGADVVLHHAALGSVPRSINNPIATNQTNVGGFLNVLWAAKERGVPRVVFASSSSVYGDNSELPKVEERTGQPLSPYAVSKVADELYGRVFAQTYGMGIIGLRYFNVFGARQNKLGPYAAVIPKWISGILAGEPVVIHGDGETSRDFCYVKNVIQMNLLAGTTANPKALGRVYNTALNARTTLNELFQFIVERLRAQVPGLPEVKAVYHDRRAGDILHSQADIGAARALLGYTPTHDVRSGLDEAIAWYVRQYDLQKDSGGGFKTDTEQPRPG